MKLNINELVSFEQIYNLVVTQKLPIKTSYKLSKLYSLIQNDLVFYKDKLDSIIVNYSEKDAEGNIVFSEDKTNIKIQPDKIEECNKELNELNDLECEIEIEDYLLDIEELPIECSVQEINSIMKFIK